MTEAGVQGTLQIRKNVNANINSNLENLKQLFYCFCEQWYQHNAPCDSLQLQQLQILFSYSIYI